MKEIARYSHCFVCGDKNESGLNARFFYDGHKAICQVEALPRFEGYRGIYHGGIVSTLLDEVMIKAVLAGDILAVTAEMTVRFHRPVDTGQQLRFEGWISEDRGKVLMTEGRALAPDGSLMASATGKYVRAKSGLRARLTDSVDQE